MVYPQTVMIITDTIINRGMSRRGGWSMKQVKLLGVTQFKKGWKHQILGLDVPNNIIEEFLFLKDGHLPKEKIHEKLLFE